MAELYKANMDDNKRELYYQSMDPDKAKLFWHVVSMIQPEQLLQWTKQVITPIEEAKYAKKKSADPESAKLSRMQSMRNWFFGKKNVAGMEEEKAAIKTLPNASGNE